MTGGVTGISAIILTAAVAGSSISLSMAAANRQFFDRTIEYFGPGVHFYF